MNNSFLNQKIINGNYKTKQHTIKITIVGDSGVGKNYLLNRYLNCQVNEYIDLFDFKQKNIICDSQEYKIKFYTQSGQKIYRNFVENSVKKSNGMVIIYDVTEKKTFKTVNYWIKFIKQKMKFVVIANNPHKTENFQKMDFVKLNINEKNHFEIDQTQESISIAFESLINMVIN